MCEAGKLVNYLPTYFKIYQYFTTTNITIR